MAQQQRSESFSSAFAKLVAAVLALRSSLANWIAIADREDIRDYDEEALQLGAKAMLAVRALDTSSVLTCPKCRHQGSLVEFETTHETPSEKGS